MMRSREWSRIPEQIQNKISSHQDKFPIPLGEIAKELGIVVKKSTLPAGISGEISLENDMYVIRVNRHDVKERQRFTLAHEIAHFLLHKEFIGDKLTDDALYRSSLSDSLEYEANRLAADIIMPWHLIKTSLETYADHKKESLYLKIAEEAEVSTTALKIRLDVI